MNDKYIRMLEQAGIPESAIENSFSTAAIQRGIKYFESDRVEITEIESTTGRDIVIHADVFGSLGYAYAIMVTLRVAKNYISIIGECDCPVGFRCKHAVATLLKFAHTHARSINKNGQLSDSEKQQIAQLEVKLWLKQLGNEPSVSRSVQPATHNNVLLYLLKPTDNESGMEVTSITSRRLKKGGYGKSRAQSLEELVDGYSLHINYEYTEQDIEIAGLLYNMAGHGLLYRQNSYPLKGDIGELTLEKLLSTQRCFWLTQDNRAPLQLGPPRKLQVEWQFCDHSYQLHTEVIPPAQELFQLKQFYYLDVQANQVGRAYHKELTVTQLQQILPAPAIPEQMATQVSDQLLQTWPEYPMPIPLASDYEIIDIQGQAFADVLLHSIETDEQRIHLLSLRFDYGGHLIQPEAVTEQYNYIRDNKRYVVIRNKQYEQACINTLNTHGFVPAASVGLSGMYKLDMVLAAESVSASVWLWHDFQDILMPELQSSGWQFHMDESFHLRIDEADNWFGELEQGQSSDWFEISLGIELDGKHINLLPSLVELLTTEKNPQHLRAALLSREHILLPVTADEPQPRWVKLPAKRVMTIFDTLVELYDRNALNRSGKLMLNKHQSLQLGEILNNAGLQWHGAEELQALHRKLQDFKGIKAVKPPVGLKSELRDYQQQGLNWLQFLREYQFNGILADDMGLGKTVQALAHLLYEQQTMAEPRPSLVIAPTSLMGNWKREAQRFTPELRVLLLHGSQRKSRFGEIDQHDIVLTTYALMLRDKAIHSQQHYHYVILDESQNIKNARSKTAQLIFQLKSEHRLCLTGTPMENHLGELWSLFHFLMPGFLGKLDQFNRLFRNPIEKQADQERQRQLQKRIKPFMLRRTKEMVVHELPEKTEMIRTIPLTGKQRDLYETVRLAMDTKLRAEISKKGLARSQIMILDALLKLRQVCCDPRLLSLAAARDVRASAKLEMLMDMLPEMVEEGRKIIIFSQFVTMLGLIEKELIKQSIGYSKLTGQTRDRDKAIAAFQEGNLPVFLISLKAGGIGLNLTAADTVIHYDPWWNPAVERQATDRAYRIGQDKPVFVYKLLTEETVEEKILHLQQSKQDLADALYHQQLPSRQSQQSEEKAVLLSQEELVQLLKPLA